MFEEVLVITLLIAIFFVVFYIIYNNKCGCNKNLIENFEEDDKTNLPYYSEDLNNKINSINEKIEDIENQLKENINEIINKKIEEELKESMGNNIDKNLLQEINKTILEFKVLKNKLSLFSSLFNTDDQKIEIKPNPES